MGLTKMRHIVTLSDLVRPGSRNEITDLVGFAPTDIDAWDQFNDMWSGLLDLVYGPLHLVKEQEKRDLRRHPILLALAARLKKMKGVNDAEIGLVQRG